MFIVSLHWNSFSVSVLLGQWSWTCGWAEHHWAQCSSVWGRSPPVWTLWGNGVILNIWFSYYSFLCIWPLPNTKAPSCSLKIRTMESNKLIHEKEKFACNQLAHNLTVSCYLRWSVVFFHTSVGCLGNDFKCVGLRRLFRNTSVAVIGKHI